MHFVNISQIVLKLKFIVFLINYPKDFLCLFSFSIIKFPFAIFNCISEVLSINSIPKKKIKLLFLNLLMI
jgi:hypothetical protein